MTYRRKRDSDMWHWCKNCSGWPLDKYVEEETKPDEGEFCKECEGKQKAGNCRG
jgi:hypothetical protein